VKIPVLKIISVIVVVAKFGNIFFLKNNYFLLWWPNDSFIDQSNLRTNKKTNLLVDFVSVANNIYITSKYAHVLSRLKILYRSRLTFYDGFFNIDFVNVFSLAFESI